MTMPAGFASLVGELSLFSQPAGPLQSASDRGLSGRSFHARRTRSAAQRTAGLLLFQEILDGEELQIVTVVHATPRIDEEEHTGSRSDTDVIDLRISEATAADPKPDDDC